jgi:2-iminoacetate synthase ThiH
VEITPYDIDFLAKDTKSSREDVMSILKEFGRF